MQSPRRHFLFCLLLACLAALSLLSCAPLPGMGGQTNVKGAAEKKETKIPEFEVRNVEANLEQAREIMAEDYKDFLEREELGFGPDLLENIITDLEALTVYLSELPADVLGEGLDKYAPILFPAIIVVFFLVFLFLVGRQSLRMGLRWQASLYVGASPLLSRLWRGGVLIGARLFPVALAIGISYFPVQAVFDRADWSVLVTRLLWLLLVYRALHATLVSLFGLGFSHIDDEHAGRLKTFSVWSVRLVFFYLALIEVATTLEYREDVAAFFRFAFELSLAIIPTYLFFARSSVLAVLPTPDKKTSAFYRTVRRALENNYYWALTATIVLLGMRAAGFHHASTFILVRGYGILLVVIATLVGVDRLRDFLERRRKKTDNRERQELFKSLSSLSRIASLFFLAWVVLRFLALWAPLKAVLKVPLFQIGTTVISPYSILSAALIIGLAILLARVVKALLLVKVFPAFNVDVGVGYAINTLVNYVLILVGFFFALTALGVNLSALTVLVASLGVGIGFGMQTLTENLISGFILLFGRSVKKGDFVTVDEVYGQVEAVGARSVVVKTPDNYDMLIPSKEIVGGKIINWSYHDSLIRVHIPVGVSYSASPSEVKDVLLQAAKEHDHILSQPAPDVWLTSFGDSAVNFELLVYFDCTTINMNRLKGQLNFIIWDALHEAGIKIPFPQRDLHLKTTNLEELEEIVQRMRKSRDPEQEDPEETETDEAAADDEDTEQQVEAEDAEQPAEEVEESVDDEEKERKKEKRASEDPVGESPEEPESEKTS